MNDNMIYDPMFEAPETDEQAIVFLRHGKTEVYADALVGIYRIRRELGQSILDACEEALRAGVGEPPRKTVEEPLEIQDD